MCAASPDRMVREPRTPRQCARVQGILDAARYAFANKPFDRVLMDDVASRAGVGKGTIYRYFPDKESLYFAVICTGIEALEVQIRSSVKTRGNITTIVRRLIDTLVSFFHHNRLFFRLMNIEDSKVGGEDRPNRRRWHRERNRLIAAIAEVLEHGQKSKALQVAYARTDAQILMGMVRSVLRHREEQLSVDEMKDEIARVFLNGVCSGTSRRPCGHGS